MHPYAAGHTDPDPERCEVMRALVAVRKWTGRIPPNAKFPEPVGPKTVDALDAAERRFDARRTHLEPVTVI